MKPIESCQCTNSFKLKLELAFGNDAFVYTFRMENLESEPLALRVSWIRAFKLGGLSLMQARVLEDRLH